MNRTIEAFAIAAAAASLTVIMASTASYGQKSTRASDDPIKFSLTIEKGKPSGSCPAGTLVTVVADAAPPGAQFAGWTGDVAILANQFIPETSATMPYGAVTITATYRAQVANERLEDLPRDLAREAQDQEAIKGLRWLLLHRHDSREKDAAQRLGLNEPSQRVYLLKEELAELWQQREGPNAWAILARMLRQGKIQRHSATPNDQR